MLRVNLIRLLGVFREAIWPSTGPRWIGAVIGLVLGATTFAVTHRVEIAMWAQWFGGAHSPWFLNSGEAARFTMEWLFVVSAVAGLLRIPGLPIAAGACAAMTVTLFRQPDGPGNLFPIVIVVGSGFLSMGVLVGTVVASVMREGWAMLQARRR